MAAKPTPDEHRPRFNGTFYRIVMAVMGMILTGAVASVPFRLDRMATAIEELTASHRAILEWKARNEEDRKEAKIERERLKDRVRALEVGK